MTLRNATTADSDRIWTIISQAKEQMRREGKDQWQSEYPAPSNIAADIANGVGTVLCDPAGSVIAYGAVIFSGEPAYDTLEGGSWLSPQGTPFVVVHRLAVADEVKCQGIATEFMRRVAAMAHSRGVNSFKVDTNHDNFYIQHLMARLGFTLCGTVHYPQGSRLAYELLINRNTSL